MPQSLTYLIRKPCSFTDTSITFYLKFDTTWDEFNEWLESNYIDDNTCYWKWRGFGIGTDDAQVVLLKMARLN